MRQASLIVASYAVYGYNSTAIPTKGWLVGKRQYFSHQFTNLYREINSAHTDRSQPRPTSPVLAFPTQCQATANRTYCVAVAVTFALTAFL
ncbi:hypothetical protein J6590_013122 [Homalodisca vitripennis]|nr:hypothetical protein J6590_013122 [Homalodisca vitripennis]